MATTPVQSTIAAVTVYNQGARVTRVTDVPTTDNGFPETIRLTGLPLTLRDDSVRVRIEAEGADAAAVPSASDIKVTLDVPEIDDSLRPADDEQLEAARTEVAVLAGAVKQIERELKRVGQLQLHPRPAGAEGQAPGASPFESRLALLDVRQRMEAELHTELAAKKEQLRAAERALHELEDQNHRATLARQAREHELRKTVVISLQSPSGDSIADNARLTFEYMVPGARWAPAYSVRFDDAFTSADLSMRASVAQDTGEDWHGVPLTLSTANALAWNELPELRSVRIGRYQPPAPKAGWRPPPSGSEQLFADYDHGFKDRVVERARAETVLPPPPPPQAPVPKAHHREETQPFEPQDMLDADMVMAGAMAEAPAMEMAMPMAAEEAPKRRPKKKSKGLMLGMARSRAAAPMAPPAAAPMPGGMAPSQLFGSLAEPEPEPELAPGVRASDDMLAYAGLRMLSPRSPQRGSLVVASRTDIYMELLVQHKVDISFDVMAVIAQANQRAGRVGSLPLPRHCKFVWSDKYDYAYETDAAVDVPSDGALHSIPVTAKAGTSKLEYVVVPRESCDVFRLAEVVNPLASPLLPGPIDVYKAGDYLLTSEVELTPPRATLSLGLGVEQRVKVSRNTRYREDAAGLIKGSLQLNHQILIEAINHLDHDISLEIRERTPATKEDEDDIKLTIKDVEPAWQPWDPFPDEASASKLRGGYRWRANLAASAKQTFKAAYEVRISAKHQLVGGNRREG